MALAMTSLQCAHSGSDHSPGSGLTSSRAEASASEHTTRAVLSQSISMSAPSLFLSIASATLVCSPRAARISRWALSS